MTNSIIRRGSSRKFLLTHAGEIMDASRHRHEHILTVVIDYRAEGKVDLTVLDGPSSVSIRQYGAPLKQDVANRLLVSDQEHNYGSPRAWFLRFAGTQSARMRITKSATELTVQLQSVEDVAAERAAELAAMPPARSYSRYATSRW
jgi:hypothetical protein